MQVSLIAEDQLPEFYLGPRKSLVLEIVFMGFEKEKAESVPVPRVQALYVACFPEFDSEIIFKNIRDLVDIGRPSV